MDTTIQCPSTRQCRSPIPVAITKPGHATSNQHSRKGVRGTESTARDTETGQLDTHSQHACTALSKIHTCMKNSHYEYMICGDDDEQILSCTVGIRY